MSNRAALYFADAPEVPAFDGRADQRPALLAELFPALWWFCCFAAEDVVAYEIDGHDGAGQPVRIACLGLRTPVARALERFERRLLASAELLDPDLVEGRERFLDILRAQAGRWLHLDASEIEPIRDPDAADTDALAYHLSVVDTADRAEALAYAEGHGLDVAEDCIRSPSQLDPLMGYEDSGPEERTVSRAYIPRYDAVYTPEAPPQPEPTTAEPPGFLAKPETLLDAVRVVSLALVGFGPRERERILALSAGAIAAMTQPSWSNVRAEFAGDGQERLLLLPGLDAATWAGLRRLLLRHTHELHAMTILGDDPRPLSAESELRGPRGQPVRLAFGYDGIGFTADDLASAPLRLRFDPAAITSERRFASLISVLAYLAEKLGVEVACAHAGESEGPFLIGAASGELTYVPRT